MSQWEIFKLEVKDSTLLWKIAQWMEKYQVDRDLDVSKIIHLNFDVKNHVISEVMDTVVSGRKRISHKKLKKFKELIEFWGKIKADYNNEDNFKS